MLYWELKSLPACRSNFDLHYVKFSIANSLEPSPAYPLTLFLGFDLTINLKSGKKKIIAWKSMENVLNFASKVCTNPYSSAIKRWPPTLWEFVKSVFKRGACGFPNNRKRLYCEVKRPERPILPSRHCVPRPVRFVQSFFTNRRRKHSMQLLVVVCSCFKNVVESHK